MKRLVSLAEVSSKSLLLQLRLMKFDDVCMAGTDLTRPVALSFSVYRVGG